MEEFATAIDQTIKKNVMRSQRNNQKPKNRTQEKS